MDSPRTPQLDVYRLARAIHADQCRNDQPPCPADEYDARRLAALYGESARLQSTDPSLSPEVGESEGEDARA